MCWSCTATDGPSRAEHCRYPPSLPLLTFPAPGPARVGEGGCRGRGNKEREEKECSSTRDPSRAATGCFRCPSSSAGRWGITYIVLTLRRVVAVTASWRGVAYLKTWISRLINCKLRASFPISRSLAWRSVARGAGSERRPSHSVWPGCVIRDEDHLPMAIKAVQVHSCASF